MQVDDRPVVRAHLRACRAEVDAVLDMWNERLHLPAVTLAQVDEFFSGHPLGREAGAQRAAGSAPGRRGPSR